MRAFFTSRKSRISGHKGSLAGEHFALRCALRFPLSERRQAFPRQGPLEQPQQPQQPQVPIDFFLVSGEVRFWVWRGRGGRIIDCSGTGNHAQKAERAWRVCMCLCGCVHVLTYVCIYVYAYVYICSCVFVCMYFWVHVCLLCMHMGLHVWALIYVCMCCTRLSLCVYLPALQVIECQN